MSVNCPKCQRETGVEGKIYNQIDYVNPNAFFRPNGLSFLSAFTSNVKIENNFFTCLACGFIWSNIDPQLLRRFTGGKEF